MAGSLYQDFVYTSTREPVELCCPLWKFQTERPKEYEELLRQFTICKEDFRKLMKAEELNFLTGQDLGQMTPPMFLTSCGAANTTFGWIFQLCINHLDFNSSIIGLLKDLQDSFSPLKANFESLNTCVSADLGSSFHLAISASGVPSPLFCWYKAAEDNGDWVPLQNAPGPYSILDVKDFVAEDAGLYKCYVTHRYLVSTPNGIEDGMFSPTVEVSVVPGSVWIKSISPSKQSSPIGTILTVFQIDAVSNLPLQYEWYHNDQKLTGQNDSSLVLNHLTLDMDGTYYCKVYNEIKEEMSEKVYLQVYVPDLKEFSRENLQFQNENIIIVTEPTCVQNKKTAIGEKISLSCFAVCKFPLKYEWLKWGLLKEPPRNATLLGHFLCSVPVSVGPQLIDVAAEVPNPVAGWTYQCIVTCPQTGERVTSREVKIEISTYSANEKILPTFKIALVICQEIYECEQYFHKLRAPKNDGHALIKALKELDFCVLAFSNLSLNEVRDALDLFCSFIDENTYALFYYNAHALGHGNEIYLAAKDSVISKDMVLSDEFLWHGEVESKVDNCNPILCVAIYDSCRDKPPQEIIDLVSNAKHPTIELKSSFCIGYGTRASMRNYEKLDGNGGSQGLYMKSLLKHITRPGITVSSIFENLFETFTREEENSVVHHMKPEFKCSTKQLFYLTTPLRSATVSPMYQRFFKLCRYEASQQGFDGKFISYLGISWDGSRLEWIVRDDTMSSIECATILKFVMHPTVFDNEALLSISYNSPANSIKDHNFPYGQVSLQIVSTNSHLVIGGPINTLCQRSEFQPCQKKSAYHPFDGPMFQLAKPKDSELVGYCKLTHLQTVDPGTVRLKTILRLGQESILCKGVMSFPVPIVKNFPKLKIKNNENSL